jgi:carbon-monoxide dehydrogenase medium subunit
VKPAPFEYLRPQSLDEAIAALARHAEASVVAGGQSLMAMLNMRLAAPSHLIDIGRLHELAGIRASEGRLRLGALVRHRQLEDDPVVAEAAPLLRQAAAGLAHPAIRNRGTIGGSLALADPAAELPACVLALGGRLEVVGSGGRRSIEATEFFRGPFETALAHGEILTAVDVPAASGALRYGYEKLARRHGDYALAGIAISGRIDGRTAHGLRIAVFGVGDRPTLAAGVAAALEGRGLDEAAIADAAAHLGDDLRPVDQPGCGGATKLHLAGVLLRRVLGRLAG